MYLGSHNMTKAAWGSHLKSIYLFIIDGDLSISNSQLGLIFIDYSKEQLTKWAPFKFPPNPYRGADSPYFK